MELCLPVKAGNRIRFISGIFLHAHTEKATFPCPTQPTTSRYAHTHTHTHTHKHAENTSINTRILQKTQDVSSLINTLQIERRLSQIRPTRLIVRLLRLHTQRFPENAHLILQPADDLEFFTPLIGPQSVRRPQHLAHFQGLRVPVITVKARLQVLVFFGLEEVIVVSALGEVVHVIIGAVVADLFGGGAKGIFVFADQLGVVALFGFEEVDGTVGFEELHFKFADLGRWGVIVSREDWKNM